MEEIKQVSNKPKSWSQCKICNESFNCKSRAPINIVCCGDLACRECVETLMNKVTEPGISARGKFKCSYCDSDHCAPIGL